MSCRVFIDGVLPRAFGMTKATLRKAAVFFAERSSARIGKPFREVAVILQDDAASDEVHRGIMDVEGATDVITQGYEAIPPEPAGVYGELYVNADQALRFSRSKKDWPAEKELLLYVAHGMDHLSGADDLDSKNRAIMRRRELKWLSDFAREAKVLLFAVASLFACSLPLFAQGLSDYAEYDYEHWYASAQALAVVPGGASNMRESCGAAIRAGYYVGDFLTIEGSVARTDAATGLGLRGLWHWWGYEKFDPFFTFGVAGWFDGDLGPAAGWGTFWHFNDNLSLRFDADAMFGIESEDEMIYSFALGVQYSF
ncbi:MAG: rRNA maturation RNase YbeY [Kiritimatiellae bacterium]|nr:rRNA maturation RNase YbeY [Kiritimatiellia bacterium]